MEQDEGSNAGPMKEGEVKESERRPITTQSSSVPEARMRTMDIVNYSGLGNWGLPKEGLETDSADAFHNFVGKIREKLLADTLPAPKKEKEKHCMKHLPESLQISASVQPPEGIPEKAIHQWWRMVMGVEARQALPKLTKNPTTAVQEADHRASLRYYSVACIAERLKEGDDHFFVTEEDKLVELPPEKQFKNFNPRRPDRAVGFPAQSWTRLHENDRIIPPGNHNACFFWYCEELCGYDTFKDLAKAAFLLRLTLQHWFHWSHVNGIKLYQTEDRCEESATVEAYQPSGSHGEEEHPTDQEKGRETPPEQVERDRKHPVRVSQRLKRPTTRYDPAEDEKNKRKRSTGIEEDEGRLQEGHFLPRKKQKTGGGGGSGGGRDPFGDIDDRFWLLCLMITNGHDAFPFVGWREPRLRNRIVFINLLAKPLNLLKSGNRLTLMRLSLNYTAIRGLSLCKVALRLLQDPTVQIPANYLKGRDSTKLKRTGPLSSTSGRSDKGDRDRSASRTDESTSKRSSQEEGATKAPQPRGCSGTERHDALEGRSSVEHQLVTLKVDFANRLSMREPESEDQGTTCVYTALLNGQEVVAKLTDEAPTTHLIYGNEKRLLRRLGGRHHTVKLLASKKCAKFSYINRATVLVFELAQPQAQRETSPTTPNQVMTYMYHLFQALEYCHSLGIVHSDVKRDNMLWDGQHNQGTLIDFGFAKDRHSPALLRESFHGTTDYMPPERKNSPAGDMWSSGILLSKLIHSSAHGAWRKCPSLAIAQTGTLGCAGLALSR